MLQPAQSQPKTRPKKLKTEQSSRQPLLQPTPLPQSSGQPHAGAQYSGHPHAASGQPHSGTPHSAHPLPQPVLHGIKQHPPLAAAEAISKHPRATRTIMRISDEQAKLFLRTITAPHATSALPFAIIDVTARRGSANR
ncbi:hypothetical protein OAS39_04480 [Pirellulales bacterium]|nr:hypothetical protein [Pirellulales bacterium]